MLRFCEKNFTSSNDIQVTKAEECMFFDENIWQKGRAYFKCSICDSIDKLRLFPVVDNGQELVCYGYQDNEANRELRMLRELVGTKEALQFEDIFPDIQRVVIYGCNELAFFFAKYLEDRQISVLAAGKYWDFMGYTQAENIVCDGRTMVVYAEEFFQTMNMDQMFLKSVSPEFECIDRIYEANVLAGKIRDTIGDFEDLIYRLRGEQEIVILGDGRESQDAYDLLLKYGIDICGFAVESNVRKNLFGKKIMSINEAVMLLDSPIFLDCHGHNGALGGQYTEYFDYYSYERNKQFFLMRDYTDIPISNLVHVLCGKKVVLAGDRRLNQILSRYLCAVENGNIFIKCIDMGHDMGQKELVQEGDIVCMVMPDYHSRLKKVREKRQLKYAQFLSDLQSDNYTEYFSKSRSFTLIETYLNQNNEKYMTSELTPKGILSGKIPPWSGNFFFKGIMDGHPEILVLPSIDFNNNLFWYCLRLSEYSSDEIVQNFWEMYDEESGDRERDFPDQGKFESSLGRFLQMKQSFTSQELFVMLHIAYAEMLGEKETLDIRKFIIYWEPHHVARFDFPFLADWLKDRKINGQTIELRRNNVVRTGSACARVAAHHLMSSEPFYTMFLDGTVWGEQPENESVFKMRFEDIKLHPMEMLSIVCKRMDIAWSDRMLKTTSCGQVSSYRGSTDFDLKPVFNKYDEFLSEFDRFRISIACSPYLKRYGYTYENCLKFSRREIQEMFLKPFLFESNELFKTDNKTRMDVQEWIKWQLWEVRKHMVLDDIRPEFGQVEIR